MNIEIRIGELQGIISNCETKIKELKQNEHGRAEDIELARQYRRTYEKIMMDADIELMQLQLKHKTTGR